MEKILERNGQSKWLDVIFVELVSILVLVALEVMVEDVKLMCLVVEPMVRQCNYLGYNGCAFHSVNTIF